LKYLLETRNTKFLVQPRDITHGGVDSAKEYRSHAVQFLAHACVLDRNGLLVCQAFSGSVEVGLDLSNPERYKSFLVDTTVMS